jgi:hypothetical protein
VAKTENPKAPAVKREVEEDCEDFSASIIHRRSRRVRHWIAHPARRDLGKHARQQSI